MSMLLAVCMLYVVDRLIDQPMEPHPPICTTTGEKNNKARYKVTLILETKQKIRLMIWIQNWKMFFNICCEDATSTVEALGPHPSLDSLTCPKVRTSFYLKCNRKRDWHGHTAPSKLKRNKVAHLRCRWSTSSHQSKQSKNKFFCLRFDVIRHHVWVALAPKVSKVRTQLWCMLMLGQGPNRSTPSPNHTPLLTSAWASEYCCRPMIDRLLYRLKLKILASYNGEMPSATHFHCRLSFQLTLYSYYMAMITIMELNA